VAYQVDSLEAALAGVDDGSPSAIPSPFESVAAELQAVSAERRNRPSNRFIARLPLTTKKSPQQSL
jgi:hypothetical protein